MKTNYLLSLLAVGCLALLIPKIDAQTKTEPQPEKKYSVHRQYDQNGNLSRYDSTVVSRWGSSNKQGYDSLTSEYHFSERNSFNNMDSLFGGNFNDPFSFNDSLLNEMMNHFGFNFFESPSDSDMYGLSPADPFFGPSFGMPGMDEQMSKQMEEMEKQMKAMMENQRTFFNRHNKPLMKVPDQKSPEKKPKQAPQPPQSPPPPQPQVAPVTPPAQNMNIFNI